MDNWQLWKLLWCGGGEGRGGKHIAVRLGEERAFWLSKPISCQIDVGNSVSSESEHVRLRAVSTVLMFIFCLPSSSLFLFLFHQLSFSCWHSGCCELLRRIKNCSSQAVLPSVPSTSPSVCVCLCVGLIQLLGKWRLALGFICLQHVPSLTKCPLFFQVYLS